MIALEVSNLRKSYKGFTLDIPYYSVESGYVTVILGKNGAGKTTFIKAILDLIKKDSGEVRFYDEVYTCDNLGLKKRIGVVFENPILPSNFSAHDVRNLMKIFYENWDDGLFQSLCEKFEINPKQKAYKLSKGTLTKLSIACALAVSPDILILDEPTSGLDPVSRAQFIEILQGFIQSEKKSIFYSTHIISDVENIADFITIIDNGKIIFSESRIDLENNYRIVKGQVEFLSKLNPERIISLHKKEYHFEALCKTNGIENSSDELIFEKPTMERFFINIVKSNSKEWRE